MKYTKLISCNNKIIMTLFFLSILLSLSVSSASAESFTFADLGIATDFTQGDEGTTSIGTFNVDSDDQQMEILLNTYCDRARYEIRIYVNDELVKYAPLSQESEVSVTVPTKFLKNGQNTIYVKANSIDFEYRPLIIYGTSTITVSENISYLHDNTITFANLGIAADFTEGNEGTTSVGTFNVDSDNQQMKILLNTFYDRARYEIRIYVNDELVKYIPSSQESQVSVTVPSELLKKGQNTIYIKASSVLSFEDRPLIIYGTSTITVSEDASLTQTKAITSTEISAQQTTSIDGTFTFSDMGIAAEFTSGTEGTTPVGIFYVSLESEEAEITVNAYRVHSYQMTVFVNDAPIKSEHMSDESTILVKVPSENLKVGGNTISVKAVVKPHLDFEDYNMLIYGTSKVVLNTEIEVVPESVNNQLSEDPSKSRTTDKIFSDIKFPIGNAILLVLLIGGFIVVKQKNDKSFQEERHQKANGK